MNQQSSLFSGLLAGKSPPDAPLGFLDENYKFFLANMAYSVTAQHVKQWFGVSFGNFIKTEKRTGGKGTGGTSQPPGQTK